MPTNPDAIGFSNQWYPEFFANAIIKEIDEDHHIKIFSLPYFVATKWEAFCRFDDFKSRNQVHWR